ncbi:hypothetical protein D3C76_1684790 [compost metagenome]
MLQNFSGRNPGEIFAFYPLCFFIYGFEAGFIIEAVADCHSHQPDGVGDSKGGKILLPFIHLTRDVDL